MVKYIDILYLKYFDENMKKTVGGVQTYISDLINLFESNNMFVRVIQFSERDFNYKLSEKSCVVGFAITEKNKNKRFQVLYDRSLQTAIKKDQLLTIFATEIIIPEKIKNRSIAIQHGIFWDIPSEKKRPYLKSIISKMRSTELLIKKIKKMDSVVCVDYNFLNWYRTQVDNVENNLCVIPNYTAIDSVVNKNDVETKIIFARRLFWYRGTKVFTNVIKKILEKYSNVHITIAGSGPDETWMKENLKSYKNVSFIKYESEKSLIVHSDKHIAVVPTIGAEGTSLSLLEAMASQCAVICTNVGGMTNIVLNGYNGIIINPGDEEQLYNAISYLIENPIKAKQMAENAYETVACSFSHKVWAENWLNLIQRFNK